MTVYNLTTNAFLELNATAAYVWELLTAGDHFDPVKMLSLRYPSVEPTRIARDVATVLKQLEEAKFVEAEIGGAV